MGLLIALVLAGSPAARQEAEQLYKFARSDFANESYKMALTEATRAYALVPNPPYLLEIAECQRALKRWAEAAVSYRSYLALPQVKNRAAIRKELAEVQSHLEGPPPPEEDALAIAPLVAAPVAPPPVSPPAAPPPPAAAPSAVVRPAPSPAPMAAVSDAPEVPSEVSSSEGGGHSRAFAYTLLGVAAAAAAFAVVGWVDVVNYNSYAATLNQGPPGLATASSASAQLSQAQTWQVVAISTTIGTALAIGGVGLTW